MPVGAVIALLGLALPGNASAQPSFPVPLVDPCFGSPEGALCDDGNPCTTGDKCQFGMCLGEMALNGAVCTDGNQCTTGDVCFNGTCTGTLAADGFACDDNNACTMGDACQGGACKPGTARTCNDGNGCTTDTCVISTGCVFTPVPMCVRPDGGSGGVGGGSGGAAGGGGGNAGGGGGVDAAAGGSDGGVDAGRDAGRDANPDGPSDGARPDVGGGGTGGFVSDGSPPDGCPATSEEPCLGGAGGGFPPPIVRYRIEGGACLCTAVGTSRDDGPAAWPLLVAGVFLLARARRRGSR